MEGKRFHGLTQSMADGGSHYCYTKFKSQPAKGILKLYLMRVSVMEMFIALRIFWLQCYLMAIISNSSFVYKGMFSLVIF